MPKILIADAIKPSLVMSSEIFKDKMTGAEILVAKTAAEVIEIVKREKVDMCLIDFDLPDADGPSLICALRTLYSGPILMSAFPDKNVSEAVKNELFAYADASAWLEKPVRFDALAEKIDSFYTASHRTTKRFNTDIPCQIVVKADGRGKRAPKSFGKLVNLSISGACVLLDESFKPTKKQEITLTIGSAPPKKAAKKGATKKSPPKAATGKVKIKEFLLKGNIVWSQKTGQMGLKFNRLTEPQSLQLESLMRAASL